MATLIVLIIVAVVILITLSRGIRIIPQARAGIVERLGRYHRTLDPGLALVVPYVDRVKPLIDLREQVVSFPPQPVITEDNLVVGIDTVVYFTVTDPVSASTRSSTTARAPTSAAAPVRSPAGVCRWRRATGRSTRSEEMAATLKTTHWSAAPPPTSATMAASTAASATGPMKKPSVKISPTASAPAAIIQRTHSSMSRRS